MADKHREEAEKWLRILRNGTDHYGFIGYVRDEASEGGFSLEDLGTSDAELEKLRVKSCKIRAQKCLGYLRDGNDKFGLLPDIIRAELRSGGFSLADIGTSEKELVSFAQVPA